MLGLNTHMMAQCRHDVQPDGQLYSSLMDVAGQAKRVDLAFDLQADMVAQGLQPSKVKPPSKCCRLQCHAVLLPSAYAHMLLSVVCYACTYVAVYGVSCMHIYGVSCMHICFRAWCHACVAARRPCNLTDRCAGHACAEGLTAVCGSRHSCQAIYF